ncbi:sodium/proline symporter PutP [Thiotrichales bacterium 19S9-12]|nr:sodium/proline symporter PutP [Thiotrichales bacterium 19S9-11]MCF6810834.1 sodium/proline symporter PutP [Thiotrichales bacterium 19S9-12]
MNFEEILIVLIVYILVIYTIGLIARKYTHNVSDFILGGRKLSAPFVALGAGASDMSGWLLLAMPGAVFIGGFKALWLPIGLAVGAYFNWHYVAKRLRIYTEVAQDSLTIPAYFKNRFNTNSSILNLMSSIAILVFFTAYASAGFIAGALLLNVVLGINFHLALLLMLVICVIYLLIGGFIAVTWVDFFQGSLMLVALLFVPIVLFIHLGSVDVTQQLQAVPERLNFIHHIDPIYIISMFAWGLGYFGQPHILVRFMSIKDPNKMYIAKRVCMSWMLLAMVGATAVGLLGFIHYGSLENPDSVLLEIGVEFLNPYLVGVLLAAVLSAIMSSIAAQLLVASSAATEDIYFLIRKNAKEKELLFVSRLMVLIISVIALSMSWDDKNNLFGVVQYAWSGMGATFGPIIIFSLFWQRCTNKACIAGVITGAIIVIIWAMLSTYGGIFKLNEIIPGFLISSIVIVLVSYLDKKPQDNVLSVFNKVRTLSKSS